MLYYDYMFNSNYINPEHYNSIQTQNTPYQQKQRSEIANFVKAVCDMCESIKKLDAQHQKQAFESALSVVAREFEMSDLSAWYKLISLLLCS